MEEAVVASQPQTTISSEADISRQQRGSQEPSSEFALHVSPFDSTGGDVAESNSQASIVTVHVDSSESLLTENITQSTTSVPSQSQGEEGEGGEVGESEGTVTAAAKSLISSGSAAVEVEGGGGGERPASVVVGIVEPERATQQPKLEEHPPHQPEPQQLQEEQKEEEQLQQEVVEEGEGEGEGEEEDREAVGGVREGETTEEEEAGVMEHVEEGAHVKDATREQADTTQKLEEGICIAYD